MRLAQVIGCVHVLCVRGPYMSFAVTACMHGAIGHGWEMGAQLIALVSSHAWPS